MEQHPENEQSSQLQYWLSALRPRHIHLDSLGTRYLVSKDAAAARAAITGEIEAVEYTLALVKSHLNALSPISRLPDELLAHIMAFHSELEPHFYPDRADFYRLSATDSTRPPARLGWISSTHVCRRWRQIALGIPGLWTAIPFCFGQDAATEFLRRSKSSALLFDVWMGHQYRVNRDLHAYIYWVYETIQDNLNRTRTLRIADVYLANWTAILSKPAPILRSFWVYDRDTGIDWSDSTFEFNAPNLHDVWIWEIENIPAILFSFSSITCLHLDCCGSEDVPDDIIDDRLGIVAYAREIFSCLQSLPLQSLTIFNSFRRIEVLDVSELTQYHLPHLTSLHLQDWPTCVVKLAHCISWPRGTKVHLVFENWLDVEQFEAFRNRFEADEHFQHMRTLSTVVEEFKDLKYTQPSICLWEEDTLGSTVAPSSRPYFRLSVRVITSLDLFSILRFIPMQRLKSLHIIGNFPSDKSLPSTFKSSLDSSRWPKDSSEWRAIFLACREVRFFRCSGPAVVEGFIRALYDDTDERTRSFGEHAENSLSEPSEPAGSVSSVAPEHALFPRLEHIYLSPVDWDFQVNRSISSDIDLKFPEDVLRPLSQSILELFVVVAAARATTSHPIASITARSCPPAKWSQDELKARFGGLVETVVVDDGDLDDD